MDDHDGRTGGIETGNRSGVFIGNFVGPAVYAPLKYERGMATGRSCTILQMQCRKVRGGFPPPTSVVLQQLRCSGRKLQTPASDAH